MRLWPLYSNSLSLRLPYSVKLAAKRKSLTHYAKGTQSPDFSGSYCLYVCGFRFYFTPLPGFFSPFLHSTGSLSVRVFSLGGWSPHLQTGCHVSRPTSRFLSTTSSTSCKGLSPSMAALSRAFHCLQSYQKLGCCNFARRYFRNLG